MCSSNAESHSEPLKLVTRPKLDNLHPWLFIRPLEFNNSVLGSLEQGSHFYIKIMHFNHDSSS